MRSILTISLSAELLSSLKRRAKHTGLSVSAYLRRLIECEGQLISEEDILKRAKEAEQNYKEGNINELKDINDLDKAI